MQQLELNIGNQTKPQPILKWAGGKRQILSTLWSHLPKGFHTYWEPFLGGGALFWEMAGYFPNRKRVGSDTNRVPIEVLEVVRDQPDLVVHYLRELEKKYNNAAADFKEYLYYTTRDLFNNHPSDRKLVRAVRAVLLNRTCFNGLWRENLQGNFNAPWGYYEKVNLCNQNLILSLSEVLNHKDCTVWNCDFREILESVSSGDFVYLDPPYPKRTEGSHTSYVGNEKWGEEMQREVARFCQEIDRKGAKFLLSNSDCPLIRGLYQDFNIYPLEVRRSINSKGSDRGEVGEVLVRNY
jgi:DNA adenine methylase